MVDLTNTQVAFSRYTDGRLNLAYYLFSLFRFKFIARMGPKVLNLLLRLRFPVISVVKRTMFRHFCGGQTIEECRSLVQEISQNRVGAILDYSVEGKESEEGFDASAAEIIRTVEESAGNESIPFAVFKLSGICSLHVLEKLASQKALTQKEEQEWARSKIRCRNICKRADELGTSIFIDAEESWIQDPIDELTRELMLEFNRKRSCVFMTIQLYRKDRFAYVKQLYQFAEDKGILVGLKLVRGAYLEKEAIRAKRLGYENPLHTNKEQCDRDYDLCLEYSLDRLDRFHICVATHNEQSVLKLISRMKALGISPDDGRVWSAQLLGMSDHISFNIASAGYNTAKYVPYGPVKEVLPYLFRRAEENSSIQSQSLREFELLYKERLRRKNT